MSTIVPRDIDNNTARHEGRSQASDRYRSEWERVKRLRDPRRFNPWGQKIGYWGKRATLV